MKITGPQLGAVTPAQLRKVSKAGQSAAVDAPQSFDQVLLSADTSSIEAARKIVAQTPDVRVDKVEFFRQQVQSGTYTVSADKIADRILTEGRLSNISKK